MDLTTTSIRPLAVRHFLLFLLLALHVSTAFEIVDQSPEAVLVPEGGDTELFCEAETSINYCKWRLPSGASCLGVSGNEGLDCGDEPRFAMTVASTRCSLTLSGISRMTDIGTYTCIVTDDSDVVQSASAVMEVKVASQSQVYFAEEYAFVEPVPVAMDVGVTIECHARGGYPKPDVKVALGVDPGVITGEDRFLTLAEGLSEETNNEDGTMDVVNYFTLVPSMADCGKYVKCEAVQRDENGELLFDDGASVTAKMIMVTFPPQQLNEPLGPFTFTPGEEFVQVDVEFMANPVPLDHEAKWKIVPSVDTGIDPVDVYAGNDFFEKYSATSLNATGHAVMASLTIHSPTYADEDFDYALEVKNTQGEAYYAFKLSTRALLITTMTPFEGEEFPADKSGVSGGTIAAIVIVVLIVIFGLIGVFWAKKNNKWCFAAYDPVKQKNDLEAAQIQQRRREVEEAPIVRSQARVPNNTQMSSDLNKPDDSDSEAERARRSSSNVPAEEQK